MSSSSFSSALPLSRSTQRVGDDSKTGQCPVCRLTCELQQWQWTPLSLTPIHRRPLIQCTTNGTGTTFHCSNKIEPMLCGAANWVRQNQYFGCALNALTTSKCLNNLCPYGYCGTYLQNMVKINPNKGRTRFHGNVKLLIKLQQTNKIIFKETPDFFITLNY